MAFKPAKPSPKASPADSFEDLKQDVLNVYEQGISIEDAERKAAKFLHAQIVLSEHIQKADLHARMSKNGYKTLKAKVYLEIVQSAEKKPTETQLESMLATNEQVAASQDTYEKAEVESEALHRLYEIFRDGHIFLRGIAKGNFSG